MVASTSGRTGAKASEFLKGYNLVVVTHVAGFSESGKLQISDEYRKIIERNGGKVLTTAHALSGAERAFRKKFGTIGPLELMANILKIFGQGTKVCVEIAIMAADAGLIPVDRDIMCIGGTSRGADTSLVIRSAHSTDLFDLKVRKILCKPSDFQKRS
ncbi:MAG: pyruvate kinase alpha/beta domain-containing protein [Nitrososphaeria archaeon]